MGCGCPSCPSHGGYKLQASIMAGALFAVVGSPQLYGLMQSLLGGLFRVADAGGAPTLAGLLLHAVVYGLLVYAIMLFKRRCGGGELRRYPYGSY